MRFTIVSLLVGQASACLAQTPQVENAKLETRVLNESLGKAMARISGTAWAGYEMPAHGRSSFGCWSDGGVRYSDKGTAYLEGSRSFYLLYRFENGSVDKIHFVSPGCVLDTKGLPLIWFTGVKAEDSVSYLDSLPLHKGAIAAIAQHEASNAVATLVREAKQSPETQVRRDALFWMSQRAGDQLAREIKASAENDPETSVKKQAVFALSQLPKDQGVPLLIELAKSNGNREVRKQAVFWLGQSNDPRAMQFLEAVLTK